MQGGRSIPLALQHPRRPRYARHREERVVATAGGRRSGGCGCGGGRRSGCAAVLSLEKAAHRRVPRTLLQRENMKQARIDLWVRSWNGITASPFRALVVVAAGPETAHLSSFGMLQSTTRTKSAGRSAPAFERLSLRRS